MADVTVTRRADGDPMRFDVAVREGDTTTEHAVTVSVADLERLGAGRSPEAFVRDCFAFLLEREPTESILSSFDVGVIGRYFPEFERVIADR
ncbi:MAG TPA: hypothetical protein VJP03_01030 [Actinomycetota bacterium]|nr:hypothetical protein [Actinomycetota bacterium]